jgi:hypothetical protein
LPNKRFQRGSGSFSAAAGPGFSWSLTPIGNRSRWALNEGNTDAC